MSPALETVAAAVTPVVMISAAAALILGINQKHAAMSDRVRAMANEYRSPATPMERRENILAQIHIFMRRLRYASTAHVALYLAVVLFVAMIMVITFTPRSAAWDGAALAIFGVGIALMLVAVAMELLDLSLAGKTIRLDISDIC